MSMTISVVSDNNLPFFPGNSVCIRIVLSFWFDVKLAFVVCWEHVGNKMKKKGKIKFYLQHTVQTIRTCSGKEKKNQDTDMFILKYIMMMWCQNSS